MNVRPSHDTEDVEEILRKSLYGRDYLNTTMRNRLKEIAVEIADLYESKG